MKNKIKKSNINPAVIAVLGLASMFIGYGAGRFSRNQEVEYLRASNSALSVMAENYKREVPGHLYDLTDRLIETPEGYEAMACKLGQDTEETRKELGLIASKKIAERAAEKSGYLEGEGERHVDMRIVSIDIGALTENGKTCFIMKVPYGNITIFPPEKKDSVNTRA